MGCGASAQVIGGPPAWTTSVYIDESMNIGFNAVSDGMNNIGPNHVINERKGNFSSDGARWGQGMTSGKHVFEVIWPAKDNRGTNSCIGLASSVVPLFSKGRVSLPGTLSQGWCLDMSRRRVIHTNVPLRTIEFGVPDRFYMYVDMDAGKVGFGGDLLMYGGNAPFYGYIIANVQVTADNPLYVMVSSATYKENMKMFYRGSAAPPNSDGFDLLAAIAASQVQAQTVVVSPEKPPADSVEETVDQ